MNNQIRFVFFGTSEFSVKTLEVLKENGLIPTLVVSTEDKPQGRGLILSPTPTKVWAEVHQIPAYQPSTLKDSSVLERLEKENADLFIVAAYGKLIPKNIFELPPHKTLNVHPSLLPKLRGASPIQSSILEEDETGVTIMLISEKMDEGPIVAQKKVEIPEWPISAVVLEDILALHGGKLLSDVLPKWINGDIEAVPQDDSKATYCSKIEKEDGLLDLSADPQINLRKVKAFNPKPGAYIFFDRKDGKKVRVVIKDAQIKDGEFIPLRVVPEGKKEMDWQDFLRGNR